MMTVVQKLRLILKISGLTQEKLAKELDVSFVTLNSWINSHSQPRKKAKERIDALYCEYTGEKIIPEQELAAKKQLLLRKTRRHQNILQIIRNTPDIHDAFLLALTYHTNSIEGSTLTEPETAAVLFESRTLSNKTLTEQLEVKNHQAAWQYLLQYLSQKSAVPNETLILKLHGMLMNGIRDDAGCYRRHGVRIVGANVPTANYLKIPNLMQTLMADVRKKPKDVLAQICNIHARFEQIHPFSDGNGRVGRLLIQAMSLKKNLPPAVIFQQKKYLYYATLQKAQLQSDYSVLEDFICDAIWEGFTILEEEAS